MFGVSNWAVSVFRASSAQVSNLGVGATLYDVLHLALTRVAVVLMYVSTACV